MSKRIYLTDYEFATLTHILWNICGDDQVRGDSDLHVLSNKQAKHMLKKFEVEE